MKKPISQMTREELAFEYSELLAEYEQVKAEGLSLDMSRGKPCGEQLDLSNGILTVLSTGEDCVNSYGTDMRNYGMPIGVPAARKLFAELCGVEFDNVFLGGNASLELMYDTVARAELFGVAPGMTPWCKCDKVKFLCPAPGYDRHFRICETFGIEMINIEMREDGPDMDTIEKLVSSDDTIKGIWCVPKHSNPTGTIYSDETVRRFAALKPAAKDFRVLWDNAYAIHTITKDVPLLSILDECEKSGNPDLVITFASTSKVTFPGGGVAAMAASAGNLALVRSRMAIQTICNDKVNQLRHARMFPDFAALKAHMQKHAALLEPKFKAVIRILEENLDGLDILNWSEVDGGYFISVDTLPNCAKRVAQLCKEAGVTLTGAGATYPYGKDPLDSNIRLAPSFPPVNELEQAMTLFCMAVKLATIEMIRSEGLC